MKILTIPELCCRPYGAACERCRIACPAHAISFDDEDATPTIDTEACTKCGICMGVCDGIVVSSATTMQLYEHLRRVAMRGEIVYLTCDANVKAGFTPAKNVTVLPCLACMAPELWTLLLAQNVPLCLVCDFKHCETCPKAAGRGEMLFDRAIEMAEAHTERQVRFDRKLPELMEASEAMAREQVDRRAAFDSVKGDAVDIVSGRRRLKNSDTLKDVYRKRERKRMQDMLNLPEGEVSNEFVEGGRSSKSMPPKRRMTLEALVALPEMAERVSMVVSATDPDLCEGCLDCVAACMTGARSISPADGTLETDARYCIACGACVDACTCAAVDLIDTTAAELFPEGPGVVCPLPQVSFEDFEEEDDLEGEAGELEDATEAEGDELEGAPEAAPEAEDEAPAGAETSDDAAAEAADDAGDVAAPDAAAAEADA